MEILNDQNVKTYRAHTLVKMLGCDIETARKLKAGTIKLDKLKDGSKTKKEEKE